VDAFSNAAKKYSQDNDTKDNGGLLGKLVAQGYCRAQELDRACFELPLGEVVGPIESDFGYHLLLIEERTNCPKLDGKYTRIVRGGKDGTDVIFMGPRKGSGDNNMNMGNVNDVASVAAQQVGFWIGVSFLGGIVAELAAKAADVIQTLPWEKSSEF